MSQLEEDRKLCSVNTLMEEPNLCQICIQNFETSIFGPICLIYFLRRIQTMHVYVRHIIDVSITKMLKI